MRGELSSEECAKATGDFIVDIMIPDEVTILLTFGGGVGIIILFIYIWATRS